MTAGELRFSGRSSFSGKMKFGIDKVFITVYTVHINSGEVRL